MTDPLINPDLIKYDLFTGQKHCLLAICACILYPCVSEVSMAVDTAKDILEEIVKKEK